MKEYGEITKILMSEVYRKGLNIHLMLNLFRKRSKLKPEIPEKVIQEVCREFLYNEKAIRSFPYFLIVLKEKSNKYFAEENIKMNIGKRDGFAPSIKEIMKNL